VDPLAGSPWSAPGTVSGFVASAANATLLAFAAANQHPGTRALDIGCGAGRNLIPLAHHGWSILGVDLSLPMIEAARQRVAEERLGSRVCLTLSRMDALPVPDASADLIIAHGIWNLSRSGVEFRRGVAEAARAARPGAALFVFTFSRHTLPPEARPEPGEEFVFRQFSGQPQCFLTATQLLDELAAASFRPDDAVPLTEHNLPKSGSLRAGNVPVIFEAAFRFVGPVGFPGAMPISGG
jgi:SAM-dependent methyltransferase